MPMAASRTRSSGRVPVTRALVFSNAVFGGVDNFSTDAHLLHAVVVLNGNCAQTSDQLLDVKYRLVRELGGVLGLDWSQSNVDVTRTPPPTSDSYAGFTIMHAMDRSIACPSLSAFPMPISQKWTIAPPSRAYIP
jgi:hypothetical protein